MPTLKRDERQTLRAIQEHILRQRQQAGADYQQMSTVGVIYHPKQTDIDLNIVTPHRGVAWTRAEDLQQAFAFLQEHKRVPYLQYLKALFPEAFARQLRLQGLQRLEEVPVWLYQPFYGPIPAEDVSYNGSNGLVEYMSVKEATSKHDLAVWLRLYQTATYGIDSTKISVSKIVGLQEAQLRGSSIFLLGYYRNYPMAVGRLLITDRTAQIAEPNVLWPWNGLGFEELLIQHALQMALMQNYQTVYTIGTPDDDATLYRRLGFVQVTQLLTYAMD